MDEIICHNIIRIILVISIWMNLELSVLKEVGCQHLDEI